MERLNLTFNEKNDKDKIIIEGFKRHYSAKSITKELLLAYFTGRITLVGNGNVVVTTSIAANEVVGKIPSKEIVIDSETIESLLNDEEEFEEIADLGKIDL